MNPIARKKPQWVGGILCLILGAIGPIAGATVAVGHVAMGRDPSPGLGMLLGGMACGALFTILGFAGLWYAFFPLAIVVEGDAICLIRRGRVIGRLPFANVDAIRIHWVPKPVNPVWTTQFGLIGALIGYALSQSSGEKIPGGILIKLYGNDDPDSFWPGFGDPLRTRDLILKGDWSRSFEKIANDLRDAHMAYLESNDMLPRREATSNPFDFDR
jgi:hypothetical protein